ncbi:glycosyltransferase family 4 protein [Adhaeribacter soli]|uniref:Glycosyltransferase family 4 protein n=1 Tax=Adhaeribacter soli TaxID=2607655 RepID=A0A5N1IJU4_9BACT|nr:glycosyltransferase family 4 protein [Adhaeribacter soli]KAA9325406.1 glycosyltransferase family 4 protein [Adhaeribacter soli]
MKILYLHQYFKTPSEGGALRSYYLSQALVQAGHTVELITSYNGTEYKIETVEGVQVHYLPVPYSNNLNFWGRIKAFLKFSWQSTRLAFKIKGVDICFATSTPLTIGIPALLLKKLRGTPYFFEVRDLWPEAPIQLGFIRNNFLKRVLFRFEKLLYKNASKVIALSPGMVNGVKRFQLQTPVYFIPNIADCAYYQPVYADKAVVPDPFIIAYIGTLGRANRLDFLLHVAEACQQKGLTTVQFIIAGTGAERKKLKHRAHKLKLTNVTFRKHLTRSEVRELLNQAAATYTSFDAVPVLETNSPNKFFDSLAAGKLSIVNTRGWLQELVEKHSCGFYAAPLLPEVFVEKLVPFLENPVMLRQYQENARKLAEEEFLREKLSRQFVKLFE